MSQVCYRCGAPIRVGSGAAVTLHRSPRSRAESMTLCPPCGSVLARFLRGPELPAVSHASGTLKEYVATNS